MIWHGTKYPVRSRMWRSAPAHVFRGIWRLSRSRRGGQVFDAGGHREGHLLPQGQQGHPRRHVGHGEQRAAVQHVERIFGVILEREADLAVIVVGIFNGDAVVCGETVVGFEEPPDGLNGWGHEISPDADGVEKRPKRDCGVGGFLPGRTGVFTFAACFASVTGLR